MNLIFKKEPRNLDFDAYWILMPIGVQRVPRRVSCYCSDAVGH